MRNVSARAADLVAQLEALHDEMRREHDARAPDLERIHVCHREGAANLVDYLTLRGHDIRPLQTSLAELGIAGTIEEVDSALRYTFAEVFALPPACHF